jgi:hypothetical protein
LVENIGLNLRRLDGFSTLHCPCTIHVSTDDVLRIKFWRAMGEMGRRLGIVKGIEIKRNINDPVWYWTINITYGFWLEKSGIFVKNKYPHWKDEVSIDW